MENYSRIFEKTMGKQEAESKVPVSCGILDFYSAQQATLASARARSQSTHQKNTQIAAERLKYRAGLQQSIENEQQKHNQKRNAELKKVVQAEKRKGQYGKEIHNKHQEAQKHSFRERVTNSRENQEEMTRFWSQHKIRREGISSAQEAAKPLYDVTVERKKLMEQRENEEGMQAKAELLKRHAGREQAVEGIIQRRQEVIRETNDDLMTRNMEKREELLATRGSDFINSIGSHFNASEEILKQKAKQQSKKIKDQQYDHLVKKETIRASFLGQTRNKSASMADCKCKRINNVEEGITKSVLFADKNRDSFYTETIIKHEKNPSLLHQSRREFLNRNHSLKSSVMLRKEDLAQKQYLMGESKLRQQNEIADSIVLKQRMGVEGNCYVRLLSVK